MSIEVQSKENRQRSCKEKRQSQALPLKSSASKFDPVPLPSGIPVWLGGCNPEGAPKGPSSQDSDRDVLEPLGISAKASFSY
jgi:hypothetical protein